MAGQDVSAEPRLDRPPKPEFGDFSSNAAMLIAPIVGEQPREVAEQLGERCASGSATRSSGSRWPGRASSTCSCPTSGSGARWPPRATPATASGPGRHRVVEKVLIEFVSANPTGPAHVATGRHAAYGDSLSRILEFLGNLVEREYYVNDFGSQVRRFGESIQARARGEDPPADGYQGDYVR